MMDWITLTIGALIVLAAVAWLCSGVEKDLDLHQRRFDELERRLNESRNAKASKLINEWLADDSDYDEETWRAMKENKRKDGE